MGKKMKLHKLFLGLLLLSIPLFFLNPSIGFGWAIGQTVMVLLVLSREAFYKKLFDSTTFDMKQYVAYVLYTIVLLAGPLLFSFFYSQFINPIAIFAAYFIDRMLSFVVNLFNKEKNNVPS